MANSVATPLIKQFSTIAGIDTITATSVAGLDLDRHPVRPRPRHRPGRGRRAGGDRPHAAPAAGRDDRRRRATARSIRPTRRSCSWRCTSDIDAADRARRLRPAGDLARAVDASTASAQVQVFGSQKYAVRIQLDPDALAARGIGIDQVTDAVAAANADHAGRHARRPQPAASDHRGQTPQLDQRGRSSATHRRHAERQAGAARRRGARHRFGREQPDRELATTARARSSSRSIASPTPTPSRSSTASRRCCRTSTTELPARRGSLNVLNDRSTSIRARRPRRRSSRCA